MHIPSQFKTAGRRLSICLTLAVAVTALDPDLLLGAHAATATAAPPSPPKEGQCAPGKPDVSKMLGVDAKTAAAVDQILQQQREKRRALDGQHEQMRSKLDALRDETDQKLAKLLTPVQLDKLRQLRPPPPQPPAPPPAPEQPASEAGKTAVY